MYQNKRSIFLVILLGLIIHKYYCKEQEYVHRVEKPLRFHVAEFNFDHVSDVYAITLWILLGSLAKVGFHLSHRLTEKFPESCLLIILGLIVGALIYVTRLAKPESYGLNSDTFFLFLLPPIILEAGYFMPNRPFFDNLGTILLLAIVNTLFNTICIGLTLYGFQFTGIYGATSFDILSCLVFAALISAVDPVAVLATFTEIHVNDMLYIVVFGESLLNDAVSVVLYRMFDSFAKITTNNLMPIDFVLGFLSFFVVALGGVLVGIIFGVIACFTTKFTEHTPVLEPLIILVYAYLAYLTSEMLSVSGILAITFCGMVMKQYVSFNISKKSDATTEYVLKMLSSIMETIIFMFMGLSTVNGAHSWNTGFVLMTLLLCFVYRVIGIAIFANIANCWRLIELTRIDMLIMSYGGLRGAIAFALALVLDETKIPRKAEFLTATIAVVFFTVFIQGITIGPLVKLLNVRRKQHEEPTMSAKLTNRMMDHVMTCLEEISGSGGSNSIRDRVRNLDRNYFKRWLLREIPQDRMDIKLLQTFKKINTQSAMRVHDTSRGLVPAATAAGMDGLSARHNSKSGRKIGDVSELIAANLPEHTVPDLMYFENHAAEQHRDDAEMHHFLDANLHRARARVPIHLRNQDELTNANDGTHKRFEKSYHHRDHVYPQPIHDREQLNGPKTISKTVARANRSAAWRNASTTDSHSTSSTPEQQTFRRRSRSVTKFQLAALPSKQRRKSLAKDAYYPVDIRVENEGIDRTAAERSRPWRHLSATDETEKASAKTLNLTSTHGKDPHAHDLPLSAVSLSDAYQKSSEYIGEYATATKAEEHSPRTDVRDLFKKQSKNAPEEREDSADDNTNDAVTRL